MRKVFVRRLYDGWTQLAEGIPIVFKKGDVICAPGADPNHFMGWSPTGFAKKWINGMEVPNDMAGMALMGELVSKEIQYINNRPETRKPRQYTIWRRQVRLNPEVHRWNPAVHIDVAQYAKLFEAKSMVPMNSFHSEPAPLP